MHERRYRHLAFIDYLGTRTLYQDAEANAHLIEDRRYELEHGIQIRLQPHLAEHRLEIGVFSDTAVIAGASLRDVVMASATLFEFVLQKTLSRANAQDVRLLRGGISGGVELRSSYLRPSPGVSVIPFYDGGLAFAYELAEVRRGSRLFLSKTTASTDLAELSRFIFHWQYMSGYGGPMKDVNELLWPALQFPEEPTALFSLLLNSFSLWRTFVSGSPMQPEEYRTTLYHFDETIKCMLRSLIAYGGMKKFGEVAARLTMLLPSEQDLMEDCNIRFLWGIWFQVILVICKLELLDQCRAAITFTLAELRRRQYLDKFIAEIDYPDYQVMKQILE